MASINIHVYSYTPETAPTVEMERLAGSSSETVVLKVNTEQGEVSFFLRGADSLEAFTTAMDTAVRAFFLSESREAQGYDKKRTSP